MIKEKYLLVDGYNIIHAWDELNEIRKYSLGDAREKLIEILANYRGFIETEIMVIFDAYNQKNNMATYEKRNNIHIVFTKESQTADSFIEYFTKENSKKFNISVATSDYMEQLVILNYGATKINSENLRKLINSVNKKMRDKFIDNKPIKNNMLFDNLDEKTKKLLQEIIKRKE